MKFLVAGLGSIGRRHLNNLIALGESDIVLLRSRKSTLEDVDSLPFPVEESVEAALNHRPDAVIVSNPTALHLDVAIPAAKAGCALLLEKPISHSSERVEELVEAQRVSGSKILVGYQFRFHPTLQICKELLLANEIGKPLAVRSHWGEYLPSWHPWEDYRNSYSARAELGGGVLLTLSHPFDYLRYIFGDTRVVGAVGVQVPGLEVDVDSCADVLLKFESGVSAAVHLNFAEQPARHVLEIVGTKGTLFWNNADGRLELLSAEGHAVRSWCTPEGFERNQMFVDEMRHFLAMIRQGVAPRCSLNDGIRAMELAQSAKSLLEAGTHPQIS